MDERAAAQRVLAGETEPLATVSVSLSAGEAAYFEAAASHVVPVDEDGDEFERRSRGTLVISNQALIYEAESGAGAAAVLEAGAGSGATAGASLRLAAAAVGRVDVPLADILTIVIFGDSMTRDEKFWFFQIEQPWAAAAHLSRFAGFTLVLGSTGAAPTSTRPLAPQ